MDAGARLALKLELDYAHPLGALAPYFDGLERGQAIASRCDACGRTWFPPRLACPSHGATVWVPLDGAGRIVSATVTESQLPFGGPIGLHVFALVAMNGAENLAFGRVAAELSVVLPGLRVRLARAPGTWPHPAQAAWFVAEP